MTQDYKTLFNFEVFALSDQTGRTVSARASADMITDKDMLVIIQIMSEQLASLIRNHNKQVLGTSITGLEEKYQTKPFTESESTGI